MNLQFLKHRWQRITARIMIAIALIVLAAGLFINFYFSPILGRTVKSMVLSSSDSLYHVSFTDANVHIFQRKIVMYNIDLEPDTNVYNRLKKAGIGPNNLYHIHIKKLALTYIHPISLYFGRKLDIDEIVLSAPEFNLSYQLNHTKDTTTKDNRTLYERISKTLRSVHVGHIGLNDVKFKYEDYSGNKVAISELKEMNLSATDMLIDSLSMTDKSRFLYCRDITTELNNFSGTTRNGLYNYKMKLLKLSTRTSQINAEDIDLEAANPNQFFDKSKHDRFTMHIDSLQMNHFNYLSYYKYRRFSASSMILSGGRLGIFSRPQLPDPDQLLADRSASFPNAGIYRLKTDLNIDSVLLRRINIKYTELNVKSHKLGYVDFNNTTCRILNLTTNADALTKNKDCIISLQSYFMNKGKLYVDLKFDMADPNLGYSYKGHLDPINLQIVNPAAMTLAMVKINGGKLKSFDFNISGDKNAAHGRVTVLYNDLKVTLLKPDTIQKKLKHMTIESLFANAMIIKHNNPDTPGEAPRSYYVNYRRPPEYAFFKTIWKTLLTGIRASAGYGEQKEKEIKTQIAERKVKKEEHKIKKAERRERRAERKRVKEAKKQLKAAFEEENEER
ncbi:hypothetical protein HQ865_00375 [Mucilaginibacter mali]|uniref:DUF748 domain-containing protein n=1 Tax=Mucilaginibacter mali TaxID=2740462 RepID=A0A7D4TSG2_9SPHI|nr:hypothetical protein [Mucilaginibacter mali]QKJ28275.1 hypothetical protein HQ865_00375 [Mucilaginibacter mali]